MKKLFLIPVFALGLNLFANDADFIKKIEELELQTKEDAILIGAEAANTYTIKKEKLNFIEASCKDLALRYSDSNDPKLVSKVVLPNCIEYAVEYANQY